MPVSKRGHEIDLSHEGAYSSGDSTIMTDKDFSQDVDLVIARLSKQRQENSDNQVLDDILAHSPQMTSSTFANADPFEAERISNMEEMGAITSDIVKSLLRNPDGMTIEDYDYFSKIQERNAKYNKEDMAMAEMNKNIEAQLKSEGYDSMEGYIEASILADMGAVEERINKAENIAEPIVESEEVATKEEMFPGEQVDTQSVETVSEIGTVESLGEAIQVNDDMEPVVQVENDAPPMTDEELEDVPVSTLEVTDDQVLKNMHNIVGNDISDDAAMALLDIMTRYKNGEKFSVYNALPESIKLQINKIATEDGQPLPRHSILEFFAKNLINDIISDAYMSTEIQNFQDELNTYAKATGNLTGVVIDSYTDEVKEKFEDGFLEAADKIQEANPEKAEELRTVAKYFSYTHSFELIKKHLENGGDTYLNRCYKKTRKINQYVMNFNAYYEGVTPKIRDLAALAIPFRQLLVDEEVAETLIVMLGDSCYEQKKGSIEGNVYAFYLLTGVMNIAMSADTSDTIREIKSNITMLVSEVRHFLNRRAKDEKYGGKKKKGKKRGH